MPTFFIQKKDFSSSFWRDDKISVISRNFWRFMQLSLLPSSMPDQSPALFVATHLGCCSPALCACNECGALPRLIFRASADARSAIPTAQSTESRRGPAIIVVFFGIVFRMNATSTLTCPFKKPDFIHTQRPPMRSPLFFWEFCSKGVTFWYFHCKTSSNT